VDHQRLPYPYRMTLIVTRQCNSRCQMCNIWQQKDLPQLSLEQFKTIVQQNDLWFLRSVTLTAASRPCAAICRTFLKSSRGLPQPGTRLPGNQRAQHSPDRGIRRANVGVRRGLPAGTD